MHRPASHGHDQSSLLHLKLKDSPTTICCPVMEVFCAVVMKASTQSSSKV